MDELQVAGSNWHHREALINGVRLHYVEAGQGPLVLLLHGFPEFWLSWRSQIEALAAAGYRVIAPDMRGYHQSGKPQGVGYYDIRLLTADVAGLIHHAGAERAVVVGHDWGGAIAWVFGRDYPELIERLIVMNAPHPAAFVRELRKPQQFIKSSYQFFFQLPWLPEMVLRAGNFFLLEQIMRTDPVRPGTFTEGEIAAYKRALTVPGALTAALNYYRAAFRRSRREIPKTRRVIECPTLLIWGERDRYLGLGLTEGLERWVPDLRVVRIPDASHWVQNDAPERVNALMLEFLK